MPKRTEPSRIKLSLSAAVQPDKDSAYQALKEEGSFYSTYNLRKSFSTQRLDLGMESALPPPSSSDSLNLLYSPFIETVLHLFSLLVL